MKNLLYLLVLLFFTTCNDDNIASNIITPPDNPPSSDNSDFEMLMKKIRDDFSKNPTITEYLKIFDNTKGAFTDIDYSAEDQTNWEPIKHINRLSDFVFAYTNPKNTYFQDESIYNKIVKGLEYWYNCNPNSSNWWSNQIDEPQKIPLLH